MTQTINIEWLCGLEEPPSGTGYWFNDTKLYVGLGNQLFDDDFNPATFENHLDLQPIDDTTFDTEIPLYLLGPITRKMTIREELDQFLERFDAPQREHLSYLIRRLSAVPDIDDPTYLYEAPGLNSFGRGVLMLCHLARLCGRDIEWTSVIPKTRDIRKLIAQDHDGFLFMNWSRMNLLPDVVAEYQNPALVHKLRECFSSIQYPPLVPICREFWKQGTDASLTGSFVRETLECSRRQSYAIARTVDMLLSERWLPSFEGLSLRYRVILAPTVRPRAWNPGLLRAFEIISESYAGMFTYLEPQGSFGPGEDFPQWDTVQVAVRPQFVSYRLDMARDGEWMYDPWTPHFSPVDGQQHLWLQESFPTGGESVTFTERSIALLGMLWSYRGSPSRRTMLYELMEFPRRTAHHNLRRLQKAEVVRDIQYPKLCLSGLEDGVFLLMKDGEPEQVDYLTEYVPAVCPYCEVHSEREKGAFWAMVRVPSMRSGIFQSVIQKHLEEKGIACITGATKSEDSYLMTTPSRLYDYDIEAFADPWL